MPDNNLGLELFNACSSSDVETVKGLIAKGANVNYKAQKNQTPLMAAVAAQKTEIVDLLLSDKRVDRNVQSSDELTALTIAIEKENITIIEKLLAGGVVPQPFDFGDAIVQKKTALFKELIKHQGISPLPLMPLLMHACRYGALEIVEFLTLQIPNIHDTTPSPLAHALKHRQGQVILYLKNHLSIRNAISELNWCMLTFNAAMGDEEALKLQLQSNLIDINTKDKDGLNALEIAAACGYDGAVKLLLSHAANPNSPQGQEHGALYLAASNGHLEVVKTLLACETIDRAQCPPAAQIAYLKEFPLVQDAFLEDDIKHSDAAIEIRKTIGRLTNNAAGFWGKFGIGNLKKAAMLQTALDQGIKNKVADLSTYEPIKDALEHHRIFGCCGLKSTTAIKNFEVACPTPGQ